jgi:hypothetical protein
LFDGGKTKEVESADSRIVQEALSFPMHCNTGEEDLHAVLGSPLRSTAKGSGSGQLNLPISIKALWGSLKEPILAEAIHPTCVYIYEYKGKRAG